METKDDVDDFLDAYRRELIAAIENGKKILLLNTSKLQAFATDARRQLMNAVQARLDRRIGVPNSDAQVDDPRAFDFLQREIGQAGGGVEGRRHVVERYAYRWFNRIIAFRYMDVHGFTGTPVVSPAGLTSTNGLPEVLAAAKRGAV